MVGFWRFTYAAKRLPSSAIIALRQVYYVAVKTAILTSQKHINAQWESK